MTSTTSTCRLLREWTLLLLCQRAPGSRSSLALFAESGAGNWRTKARLELTWGCTFYASLPCWVGLCLRTGATPACKRRLQQREDRFPPQQDCQDPWRWYTLHSHFWHTYSFRVTIAFVRKHWTGDSRQAGMHLPERKFSEIGATSKQIRSCKSRLCPNGTRRPRR